MDIPILVHPAYPDTFDRPKATKNGRWIGSDVRHTIALTRIILAGIPDRYPKLKLLCLHVGGAPYLVGDIARCKRGAENIRKPPRNIYLDTVPPLAIQYGFDFARRSRTERNSGIRLQQAAVRDRPVEMLGRPAPGQPVRYRRMRHR